MRLIETRTCGYCGQEFRAPIRSGPPPTYCSQAHRQRAYEQRRAVATVEAIATADEVQTLHARVRRLEHENRKLREELTETSAEYARLYRELHPLRPGQIDFATQPHASTPPVPEAPEPPKRRRSIRRQR